MPEDNIQQKDSIQLSLGTDELRDSQLEALEAEAEMTDDEDEDDEDFEDDNEEDEDY